MEFSRYAAPWRNWCAAATALVIGCGPVACGAPPRNPLTRTSTTTPSAAAAPTTDTTSARPHGGTAREALAFPGDTPLELYPLERALLVARVVQEDPAAARTPGLELHLLGTSNPPPPAALHAGLPAASNTAYVHGRVQSFVGRWPDAAYAIVLDDPGDPKKLTELALFDHTPAQLFRWTGQLWSAAAPFTNVARAMASTPRALWILALRGEPGRARERRALALWRMA